MRTLDSLPLQTLLPCAHDEAVASLPAVVSGREAILSMQTHLRVFAEACGQPELAASLAHFLDPHYVGQKTPHLLLFGGDRARTISGAVLVYQYRLAGLPLRIFLTEDVHGERNILAPAAVRSQLAVQAATYLMQDWRAHIAILSLRDGEFNMPPALAAATTRQQWACGTRTGQRYLEFASTYDETLASLGNDTRRNFRRAVRKAERDLGCNFVPRVEISFRDFLALDARCDYPVSPAVAQWRYRSAHAGPDTVIAGLRSNDGRWISLVGGRRSHGTLAIDWQMNPTELRPYSPSTVMRAHLLQYEHALGTSRVLFEGGTPHTMAGSLRTDTVTDLVAVSGSVSSQVLRRYIAPRLPTYNFLRQTLQQSLDWYAGMATAREVS